jgi:SAM-dependent methyltransferase
MLRQTQQFNSEDPALRNRCVGLCVALRIVSRIVLVVLAVRAGCLPQWRAHTLRALHSHPTARPPRARARAPRSTPIVAVRADIGRMPCATGSVDAIHAGAAIHCWPNPQAAMAEISRVLKPGGVFVASTFLTPFAPLGELVGDATIRPISQVRGAARLVWRAAIVSGRPRFAAAAGAGAHLRGSRAALQGQRSSSSHA